MKRTPSVVWRFFDRIEQDGRVVAIVCKLCEARYKYFGNTTNLRCHLVNKHPIQWELGQNGSLEEGFRIAATDDETNLGSSRHRQKRYRKAESNDNVDVLESETDNEQHGDDTQTTINLVKQLHRGSDEEWLNEEVFDTVTETYKQPQKKRKQPEELAKSVKLTSRERRFIKFASVEHGGQLYMTPQDFLESVVEQEPRPRLKRRVLSAKEIEQLRDSTPQLKRGSSQMFRNMRDKGIISYTEYLFLLSILTKPASGFQIAFNMFDTDGNQRVDKNEFLVIQRLLGGSVKERKDLDVYTQRALLSLVSANSLKNREDTNLAKPSTMEKIFSFAWRDKRGINEENKAEKNMEDKVKEGHETHENYHDDQGLQRRHNVDTMLQVHFFGKKGNNDLRFEGFRQFMENLQTEVLELEFHEFSKGHETISEVDFAKILLRYTYLDTDEYDMYLDRLLDRVKYGQGITFHEFKTFCQFLNNLEDFTIAMRMYTLADHPISKDEFHRAVKICTGIAQSEHLVSTVFAIFDADGDGLLSYKEFIAIMKDRLHRGFKSSAKNEGWEAFKSCVKQEMKSAV